MQISREHAHIRDGGLGQEEMAPKPYTYNGTPAFNTPHDMRYGYANSKGLRKEDGGYEEPSPMCKFLFHGHGLGSRNVTK